MNLRAESPGCKAGGTDSLVQRSTAIAGLSDVQQWLLGEALRRDFGVRER